MTQKTIHWNRHVGATFSEPHQVGDGIDFCAVSVDGRQYNFHLELSALKALDAEAFYDEEILPCFQKNLAAIERVAGSLIMLDVRADPIRLKASYFTESPWRRHPVAA